MTVITRNGALWHSEDGRRFCWDDDNDVFRGFDVGGEYRIVERKGDDVCVVEEKGK